VGSAGTASGTAAPEKVQHGTWQRIGILWTLMRAEGADDLQWIWHVNWLDEPEKEWNRFENYSSANYATGSLSAPMDRPHLRCTMARKLAFKMRENLSAPSEIAPGKPIIIAEFGCDLRNRD